MGSRRLRIYALTSIVLLASIASSGCVSYGSHLGAVTLAPGKREVSVHADALLVDRGVGPQVLPNPGFAYRVGVVPNFDVGGRANLAGLELNARWRFLQHSFADLALVPALGFGFVPVTNPDTGLFDTRAMGSALASVHLSPRSELVLGARGGLAYTLPMTAFRGDPTGDDVYYLVGGVLGVRVPVGARTYLFPDVNVLFPYDTGRAEWQFPAVQGGIGFAFE